MIEDILKRYGKLLGEVDQWLASCVSNSGPEIACASGCAECCRGLFDITLLDACYLKSGFDGLDAAVKDSILKKAQGRIQELRLLWPDLAPPYILNYRPEEEWEVLMPDDDETPCPLLDADGRCLVYAFRPMTCRLHGLPLVDINGEVLHDEWCTHNFLHSDPLETAQLRGEFTALFRRELLLFRDFTRELVGERVNELDTFIPTALLIDYKQLPWKRWWQEKKLSFAAG